MRSDDIAAFVRCLCHKESAETGAQVHGNAGLTRLLYISKLQWEWPRQFGYQAEYFCEPSSDPVAVLAEAALSGAEHVLNIFHPDIEAHLGAEHTLAWISTLLARDLNQLWPRVRSVAMTPIEVRTTEEKLIADSLLGISNPPSATNEFIHNFYVAYNNAAVAKGQLVYLGGAHAYVSDMYTVPAHRQQGHCSALMVALEHKARLLGATRIVLAPGLEAAEAGVYEQYGYRQSAVRAVVIRAGDDEVAG